MEMEDSTEHERESLPPPPTAATESLSPISTVNHQHSCIDRTLSERNVSFELDTSRNPSSVEVALAATTTTQSHHPYSALAVAETVLPISSSPSPDLVDLHDHIEGRAIEIAGRVLDDIRLSAIDAGAFTVIAIAERQDPQSFSEHDMRNNKELWSTPVRRQRIRQLLGIVTLLAVVVIALTIALVIVIATRKDSGSNSTTAMIESERCSFCAGGGKTPKSMDQLRITPIGVVTSGFVVSFPTTCADVYQYRQRIPSTDSSCPVFQKLAFNYCGCETLPPQGPHTPLAYFVPPL